MATNNHPTGRSLAAGVNHDQVSRRAELRSPNGKVATQNWAMPIAWPTAGFRRAPLDDSAGSPAWFPSDRGPSQRRRSYGAMPPTSQTLKLPLLINEDRAGVARRVHGPGGSWPIVCCAAASCTCAWTDLRAIAAAIARVPPSDGCRSRHPTGGPNMSVVVARVRHSRPENFRLAPPSERTADAH